MKAPAVSNGLIRHGAIWLLCVAAMVAPLTVEAAQVYIGDDAAEGLAVTAGVGTQADSLNPLTYVSTAAANRYTVPSAQLITLTEVNFLSDEGGGTLKPFVARYNGGNNQQGASYTVIAIGDLITPPAGVFAGGGTLVNAAFTVGGLNPTLSVSAGDVLVAGWQQSSRIVLVSNTPTSGTVDYISQADTVPASTGQTLTGNSGFSFDRTMRFNVGFNVPEPTAALLALPGLALLRRRRRAARPS